MLNPLLVREGGAALLLVVGAIVLGIAVHAHHMTQTIAYKPTGFTFNIFVGAWTVFSELVLAACRRYVTQTSMIVELGILVVAAIFYLVSGDLMSQSRTICSQLDDLSDVPAFENADGQALRAAHDALSDVCSQLEAEFGFIWIGFTASMILLGYLLVHAFVLWRVRGEKKVWLRNLRQFTHLQSINKLSPLSVEESRIGV